MTDTEIMVHIMLQYCLQWHRLAVVYSTATFTLALSSAFGIVNVSTPSSNFAVTALPSTACGSQTVRVKLELLLVAPTEVGLSAMIGVVTFSVFDIESEPGENVVNYKFEPNLLY